MFWADRVAKEIITSGRGKPYWVDDMFTPSGFAHIGSLRGPLVHDLIYRALKDCGEKTVSTYVFNDFDPIDGLPPDLTDRFSQYLGYSLRMAPSPVEGFRSFAEYFAHDFQTVLKSLGVGATFLSSWDMYHEGKFNKVIKIALDNAERIQDIYQKVSGSKKREKNWLPLQVICQKCQKLGTTRVHNWDGEMVSYTCEPAMVTWAKGCGFEGKISPYDGNGKLPWKVDWSAHWKVMKVTIEGAGKDHYSAGGSRDIAKALCKEVFHIDNPYDLPYEFFLIGGKKMSSSKGLGLKARDLTTLLPPAVGRFLFCRTDYRQSIEIDLFETMAIPDLFDEYDRCWQAYNTDGDDNLRRAFELAQIAKLPQKNKQLFIPRFRDVANYIQLPNIDIDKKFEELKGNKLTKEEQSILDERIGYAKVWIDNYAPSDYRIRLSADIPKEVTLLSADQKDYLKDLSTLLENDYTPDDLQLKLYNLAKDKKIDPKKAFSAIYLSLLGKTHGPKAAWFILSQDRNIIRKRFKEIGTYKEAQIKKEYLYQILNRPDLFQIDKEVKRRFPTINVGIAIIKGVEITKSNPGLEKEGEEFVGKNSHLTTQDIGLYPEIKSYRRIYKETGVDWHSKRSSPEALLRRIVLGKGAAYVNTCVDAYNLVVMKNRVSAGAFNLDEIKFPTILRFAKKGEKIHMIGEGQPTEYEEGEIAYFDRIGGYNIDFNYRDAIRTTVDENTKNLWINTEGVYEISREQVERTLKDTINIILKYCGGKLEIAGIVSAT